MICIEYEFMIDHSGLNGIQTHDLCDTAEVLYQLSYQIYDLSYVYYYKEYHIYSCISQPPTFKVKNRIFHHFWLKKL